MTDAAREMKKEAEVALKQLKGEIIDLSQQIFDRPELGHQEYFASGLLAGYLESKGFTVTKGIAGLETAFKATYGNQKKPQIALLAEYDALPDLGHGCGHNLIGAASAGAAVLVKVLLEPRKLPGQVVVFGTPAEETSGGKVTLVKKKSFAGIDAALMFHPGEANVIDVSSLTMEALEFTYHGRTAHAAAAPHLGINALDGVIQLFNGVNSARQYLEEDVRIHGIIAEGGVTPNIIPDRATAKFYIRAVSRYKLDKAVEKVLDCAKGAALTTGCKVTWHNYELSYDEMITNKTLAKVFEQNLRDQGIVDILPNRTGGGSLDMGNVSQVVPAIHPYLALSLPGGCSAHTRDFAQAAGSKAGHQLVVLATQVLANTVIDLLANPILLQKAQEDFRNRK
jgi:amidohydrolase